MSKTAPEVSIFSPSAGASPSTGGGAFSPVRPNCPANSASSFLKPEGTPLAVGAAAPSGGPFLVSNSIVLGKPVAGSIIGSPNSFFRITCFLVIVSPDTFGGLLCLSISSCKRM